MATIVTSQSQQVDARPHSRADQEYFCVECISINCIKLSVRVNSHTIKAMDGWMSRVGIFISTVYVLSTPLGTFSLIEQLAWLLAPWT